MTFGILAGSGHLPVFVHEALYKSGTPAVVAGISGQTDESRFPFSHAFEPVPVGALKQAARFFRFHRAHRIFFLGAVKRTGVLRHTKPDTISVRLLFSAMFGGDDYLLRDAACAFLKLGIAVIDPGPWILPLFAETGLLAGPAVSSKTIADLTVARDVALQIGRNDKGQAAVAKDEKVIALEGRRGTDALIASISNPGAVLVKMVKPGQDRRFDLPALGERTILNAAAVGITAIGVQTSGVLLLEKEKIFAACDSLHVSLVGLKAGDGVKV